MATVESQGLTVETKAQNGVAQTTSNRSTARPSTVNASSRKEFDTQSINSRVSRASKASVGRPAWGSNRSGSLTGRASVASGSPTNLNVRSSSFTGSASTPVSPASPDSTGRPELRSPRTAVVSRSLNSLPAPPGSLRSVRVTNQSMSTNSMSSTPEAVSHNEMLPTNREQPEPASSAAPAPARAASRLAASTTAVTPPAEGHPVKAWLANLPDQQDAPPSGSPAAPPRPGSTTASLVLQLASAKQLPVKVSRAQPSRKLSRLLSKVVTFTVLAASVMAAVQRRSALVEGKRTAQAQQAAPAPQPTTAKGFRF